MKLSENFDLEEMLESQAAIRFGFSEQFEPSDEVLLNLKKLCWNVLESVREITKSPITVSSGSSCPRVNKKIGGASKSQHIMGQAADIKAKGYNTEQLFRLIIDSNIQYDQIIQEFADEKGNGGWVHISYSNKPRKERLIAKKVNGKTVYAKI